MGWGGSEGWSLHPHFAQFCLSPSPPHPTPPCMTEKFFLPPSTPLRTPRIPAPPYKTLLLINLSTTIIIVFNKTCFINKNILDITNKFIPSNQNNFQQKLNNIIKVFNKTISQHKQKSHNTKSMIQQYINLFIIKKKENVKIYTLFPTLLERERKKKKKKEAESFVGQNKIS